MEPSNNLTKPGDSTSQQPRLDKNYRIHNSEDFKFGKILMVPWTEPNSQNKFDSLSKFGESCYLSIRRLLIIKEGRGHSLCLPLSTYEGEATLKHGVYAEDHAVIYTQNLDGPVLLEGEHLTKQPICVTLLNDRYGLDKALRLNFGKVYTVEHNFKVCFIGEVIPSHKERALASYLQTIGFDLIPDSLRNHSNNLLTVETDFTQGENTEKNDNSQEICSQHYTEGYLQTEIHYQEPSIESDLPRELEDYQQNRQRDILKVGHISAQLDAIKPESGFKTNNTESQDRQLTPTSVSVPGHAKIYEESIALELKSNQSIEGQSFPEATVYEDTLSSGEDLSPASSVFESIFSRQPSQSSIWSHIEGIDWGEQLVRILSEDEMRKLYAIAFCNLGDSFEITLRHCIKHLSEDLRHESSPGTQSQAAALVRLFARNIAHSLRIISQKELKFDKTKLNLINELRIAIDSEDQMEDNDIVISNVIDYEDETEDEGIEDDETIISSANEHESLNAHISYAEDFIRYSKAYIQFKENIKIFAFPDPAKEAIFMNWNHQRHRSSHENIKYRISWELPTYLAENYASRQDLGEVLTLSGDPESAQATGCRDYLETNWPSVGLLVLDVLGDFLLNRSEVSTRKNKSAEVCFLGVEKDLNDSKIPTHNTRVNYEDCHNSNNNTICCVTVRAAYETQIAFLEAISWLCATFRHSEYCGIATSSTTVRAQRLNGKKIAVSVSLRAIQPIPESTSCWHSLFPYSVIALGFPIRTREQGRGLEISFADMALACQSKTFIEYDSGLVVEGLKSLLIPVCNLKTDKALQWHFEDKSRHPPDQIARVSYIMKHKVPNYWYRELLPNALVKKRAFLGWVPKISYAISLTSYQNTVGISRASRIGRKYLSYNVEDIMSDLRHSEDVREKNYARTLARPMFKTGLEKSFSEIFIDGSNHYVTAYDTIAETCWELPKILVVLFVLRELIRRRRYEVWDGEIQVEPDSFATSGTKEDIEEALKKLIASTRYQFSDPFSDSPQKKHALSKTTSEIWHLFDTIASRLDNQRDQCKETEYSLPKYLHGVEFLDILEMAQNMEIKRLCVDQNWCHLTIHTPVILFCTGIGQPLIPNNAQGLCYHWQEVPSLENNFVVPTTCLLDRFLCQDGSFLCRDIEWSRRELLMQNHDGGDIFNVVHTQTIQKTIRQSRDRLLRQKLDEFKNGCFVFAGNVPNEICAELPPSDDDLVLAIHKTTVSDLDCSGSDTSMESIGSFASTNSQQDSTSSQDSDKSKIREIETLVHKVQFQEPTSIVPLYEGLIESSNATLIPMQAIRDEIKDRCSWEQEIKIFNREDGTFITGLALIDPGNTGPNIILTGAMQSVCEKPYTNCDRKIEVYSGEVLNISGGKVKLQFSGMSSKSTRFTKTFRYIPKIAGGYTMILNRKFFEDLWPDKLPGNLMIRSVRSKKKTKESKDMKRRNEDREKQRELQSKRIKEQEAERQAANQVDEETRLRGG